MFLLSILAVFSVVISISGSVKYSAATHLPFSGPETESERKSNRKTQRETERKRERLTVTGIDGHKHKETQK